MLGVMCFLYLLWLRDCGCLRLVGVGGWHILAAPAHHLHQPWD